MKRLLAAAALTMLTAFTSTSAQEAPPISPAQLQKILKSVDAIGAKEQFPPPTGQSLGLLSDATQSLPVVVVVTNDHKVYFCRSQLNPEDFIIWTRTADKDASYMFSTHADFNLVRALYLHEGSFPENVDGKSSQVQAIYKSALTALAKDVDSSPLR